LLIGLCLAGAVRIAAAQNFGSLVVNRKKIVLVRKLPPTGHIEGVTFNVVVTLPAGMQADVGTDLQSTLESLLIRSDSRLRSEDTHPETTIACHVTSYAQPQPQQTSQAALTPGAKNGSLQNQPMERVTGVLTVSFQARDRAGHSLAADNVTAKFDQEYTASGAQQGIVHSVTHTVSHLTKGGADDDTPPTAVELHNRLIQDAAQQIAAHLVNTTEQVEVYLAKGGGLDQADKLIEQKLWSRALEQLETMKPFPTPEDDAYRLYDLGVVNEAMAYSAEDLQKARKELQEASIDYGKAIDGKPTEKYFLQPQTRIDTALAHYKLLGDQKTAAASSAASTSSMAHTSASTKSASGAAPADDALTNDQVISMSAAKLDEANIIDTIQHAKSVNFDLSPQGQVDLAKSNVSGKIIAAMKARARAPVTHRAASAPAKSPS
jgi:hypothetical protein